MDRALKERIVGATVLVVIAVLVVPVFLDGPADEPQVVTEPVTLPGQAEQNTKRQTIVLERDREEPVPQSGDTRQEAREAAPAEADKSEPPVAAAPQRSPAPKPESPRPETPPADEPAPAAGSAQPETADSATGMWAVQLGSFSNPENAERLARELRTEGYAAFLSRVQTSSDVLHRVRVGPQQNRASAEAVAAKLTNEGHEGQVVPHP